MIFNSLQFALFFGLVILILPLLTHRLANLFLVAASCIFYGVWSINFLLLLTASSLANFWMVNKMAGVASITVKKRLLSVIVAFNLVILAGFKYFGFFASNFGLLLDAVGITLPPVVVNAVAPLALSFFTFHCISYAVDVYKEKVQPAERWTDYFLYLMLFPHLVAGPIVRAAKLLPQIQNPRRVSRDDCREGISLMLWGFFKKMVVADNLGPKADLLFSMSDPTGGQIFVGVLAFTFQIYADFSGYTDIARGCARLIGFQFDLNFRNPYYARNPQDFWRRWHISLSEWLRDYLYIPLGGSQGGRLKTCRNLIITMVLGGLWHGAAWNFVLWGAYHGFLLACHRFWSELRYRNGRPSDSASSRSGEILSVTCMFVFTMYGWLLFRATSFEQILGLSRSLLMVEEWQLRDSVPDLLRSAIYIAPMMVTEGVMAYFKAPNLSLRSDWKNAVVWCVVIYVTLFLASIDSETFIYFNF